MNYIVFDSAGKIQRTGVCPPERLPFQANGGEFAIEGTANDVTQKIVDGKVVNKTAEEVETDNPAIPRVSSEKYPANITSEQWQDVLDRIEMLENR